MYWVLYTIASMAMIMILGAWGSVVTKPGKTAASTLFIWGVALWVLASFCLRMAT